MSDIELLNLAKKTISKMTCKTAVLALWTTKTHFALALKFIEACGFKYLGYRTWAKLNKEGNMMGGGLGRHYMNRAEPMIIATRGRAYHFLFNTVKYRPNGTACLPRGRHSEKPIEFYDETVY